MIGSQRLPRMKRMNTKLRKVVLGLAVMVAACLVATIFFLDAVAARILSTAATQVLGTPTTVRSVHLGLFDGRSTLDGLQVAQPAGFGEGFMFSVQHASVTAGLFELIGDDVVIESIEIDGVDVNLVESEGRVNLQVVANNVTGSDTTPTPATTEQSASARSVTIRTLRVTNIHVSAAGNSALVAGKKVHVTIPDIVVSDLGTKTPMSEVAARVSTELVERLTVAIVQAKIEGLPSEMASGLASAASTLTTNAKSLLENSGDAIQKGLKGAGDAIKGLFGD